MLIITNKLFNWTPNLTEHPILFLATLLQSLLIKKKKRIIFLYGLFVNWANCAKAPQGDEFVNESESESHSVVSNSLQPHGIVHGILQARILEWVAFPFSRGSSQPRDRTQVSCIAGRFFTSWATGKPKNTGVGSLSILQGIFLTQELNWGLLHCRWILYQLSYQGSP